jgi:predicted protein tyrosine phosphatase
MQVTILNKETFDELMRRKGITDETVETFSRSLFISINDTGGTNETPYFKQSHPNVLTLFFDDCNEDMEVVFFDKRPSEWMRAMNEEQAKQVVDLLNDNRGREFCFVHCAAGISRSGAVGTFVNDYFRQDYLAFKKRNPYIHPNSHVLTLLRRTSGEIPVSDTCISPQQ